MKKLRLTFIALALGAFLTSCGVNNALILNHNTNSTQVHLASDNYKVVDRVTGSDEVSYVLVFGGLNKKQLFRNAYAHMVNKADLESGSKALVNIVTEESLNGFPPIYYTRTVTVSAHVIEFTK